MNLLKNITEIFEAFFDRLTDGTLSFIPGLLLIIFIFIVALVIGFIARVFFKMIGVNKYVEKSSVSVALKSIGIDPQIHLLLGNIVFWIVFVLLLDSVARVSGWSVISNRFTDFSRLIPLIIGSVVIVAIGFYISRLVSNITKAILIKVNSKAAGVLSNVVFYGMLVISITIALSFIGIRTTIITTNVSIILGAVLLAFSISFVFGAKDILKNILSSSYNKSNYKVGQIVEVDGFKGEIIKMTNISVFIKSTNTIRVIPAKRFTENVIDIVGKSEVSE